MSRACPLLLVLVLSSLVSPPLVAAQDAQDAVILQPVTTREETALACQNGVDDDGDGRVDCGDPECHAFVFCVAPPAAPAPAPSVMTLVTPAPVAVTPAEPQGPATLSGPLILLEPALYGSTFNAGFELSFSLLLGTRGSYFTLGARAMPGVEAGDDADFFPSVTAELGYRGIYRTSSGIGILLTVLLGYQHTWEVDSSPEAYHCPHARVGSGFVFGRGRRFNVGVDATAVGGYCIQYDGEGDASAPLIGGSLGLFLSF